MPSKLAKFGATVIGSGPAGVCVVGNLLAQRVPRILWVDPLFEAGRLNNSYREVPSNTKAGLFLSFAEGIKPFQKIIENTPEPNAVSKLKKMKQDEGCSIAAAADMCRMLTAGLVKNESVQQATGLVQAASWKQSKWDVSVNSKEEGQDIQHSSNLLVLANGAYPTSIPLPKSCSRVKEIHLDTVLKPSVLKSALSENEHASIAVIGTSHSAVLALLNLYTLATTTHPHIKIKWFARSDLLYAVPMDGWILRDNTGLKGQAATWAKENLEEDKLQKPEINRHIEKVKLQQSQSFTDSPRLPECDYIVQAVGYRHNPLPDLLVDGQAPELEYDPITGNFSDKKSNKKIPGLHGAGIAWPERVTDPYGNVEHAVGMFKFMKYLKRVVPEWTK